VKIDFRKIVFRSALLLYLTLFPTTSLIKQLNDSIKNPEDLDEHMFI
jgi:hypothetical protein